MNQPAAVVLPRQGTVWISAEAAVLHLQEEEPVIVRRLTTEELLTKGTLARGPMGPPVTVCWPCLRRGKSPPSSGG